MSTPAAPPLFADVVLPLPLPGRFTYRLPDALAALVAVGCRVSVPFGKGKVYTAIVAALHSDEPQGYKVKSVLELLDEAPILLPQQFALWEWIARYYLCSVGEVYKAALPQGLKGDYRPRLQSRVRLAAPYRQAEALQQLADTLHRSRRQQQALARLQQLAGPGGGLARFSMERKELAEQLQISPAVFAALVQRGVLELYQSELSRLCEAECPTQPPAPLTAAQQAAYGQIKTIFEEKKVCLLHGVTSSGKTEVYIHLIHDALQRGEQVLYLLPEIALTQQITDRLRRVFGNRVGIYHSKFSDAERVEVWKKQLGDSPYDVILGVRSSIFLPFTRLGLVIVDEEHENSYKQQEPAPRYHARNAAIVLASMQGAHTLLGSATPSLESCHNAQSQKYGLVQLTRRYRSIELPQIEVVDIKELKRRRKMQGPFSPLLVEAMQQSLAAGRQVILFQNRRGYTPLLECNACGWVPRCPNCDVSLTYHRAAGKLTCHYCGHSIPAPRHCPQCGGGSFRLPGFGTEKIEEELGRLFPGLPVARMDLDTTRSRAACDKIIGDFERGDTRILIGTQMVSKGLDFENVEVVGILDADNLINYPDFRAAEHAFQLMAQVAGRAGRHAGQGRVVLQTMQPQSPLIALLAQNGQEQFYRTQMQERELFHYPPYYRIVSLYMRHRSDTLVDDFARHAGEHLRSLLGNRVLGPDLPPVARVQQKFIRKIMIKIEGGVSPYKMNELLARLRDEWLALPQYRSVELFFDVDPQG